VKYANFPLSVGNVEIEYLDAVEDNLISIYDFKRVMLNDILESLGKTYVFDLERYKRKSGYFGLSFVDVYHLAMEFKELNAGITASTFG